MSETMARLLIRDGVVHAPATDLAAVGSEIY